METKDYINQWKEVKEMTKGMTMDDIRSTFAKDITNDLRAEFEAGLDHDIIDVNVKDILVTFIEKRGKAKLHTWIEMYAKNGEFLGVVDVKKYQ